MQQWLLVSNKRRFVRLLAFAAYYITACNQISLAQVDDFQSESPLTPQIDLQDLELDSMFANLFHGQSLFVQSSEIDGSARAEARLTHPTALEKRVLARNQWISPRSRQHARKVNQRTKKAKTAKWVASKSQHTSAKAALGRALSKPRGDKPRGDNLSSDGEDASGSNDLSSKRQTVLLSNLPPLTQQQKNLRDKIRRVLTHYYNRPLNTRNRSPWELMHAMLAFEVHSQVLQGGPDGDPITAVGWLCFNQPCKRRTLMYLDKEGEIRVRVGPALQGHRGQLLAMLAQSSVKREYPIRIEDREFTVADLIEREKRTCYPRTELTFKLISMAHYLESDAQWLNDQGMEWDIPRLIREELRQPVRGAACGGTHRLSGLTLAYKKREKRGEPVDGDYLRAKKFVQNYQRYAYRLQNSDGSFSTEWFRGRGAEKDLERRLKTTGHLLEWLLYASTDKELYNWRTTRAANYLANIMYRNRYRDWEAGPLGHAIHALLVYDRMVFGKYDKWQSTPIASKSTRKRR